MKRLTTLAHAVRFAMRCGITDVAELARELECTPSAVYRALKQISSSDHTVESDRTELTVQSESVPTVKITDQAVTQSDGTVTPPRAHAYKESPSEIIISKKMLASSAHACEEIDGLNGSTSTFVGWLATWLNEWAPDHETARELLASNCACYGPKQVMAGMIDLKTQIAAGQKPRNLVKSFSGFVRNASTEPKPSAKVVQATAFSEALARRMARKEAVNG